MKKAIILGSIIYFLLLVPVVQAQLPLQVDFNSTTQDSGPHPQPSWSSYDAGHEVASDFITPRNYSGITVTPTWPNTSDNRVMQMIDRGASNDATWNDAAGDLDLVTDWIGIDTRTGNGGNGDWNGATGTPTYLAITIGGLPAGDYGWTSFHHDTEHCFGTFEVWLSTNSGSSWTQLADGLMTDGTPGGSPDSGATEDGPDAYTLPSTYVTSFTANGADDVVMRFAPYAGIVSSEVHNQIWAMNGFEIVSQNPCSNQPPTVQGPESLSILSGDSIVIDLTVTDDGKPYIEGCDPEDPDTGTSYELQYLWSQPPESGPAEVTFNPITADVKDTSITFPKAGTYQLLLQVWDGPLGPGSEEGKMTEYFVIVEALEPLDGDIDLNGVVNQLDLWVLISQWLDSPACQEVPYCADLNYSGSVTLDDYALLTTNWLFENTKVTINEFVANNQQSFLDGDGNSSDWIELYNSDTVPISLAGWYLTDDRDNLQMWPFPPQAVISAGGYLVVFASEQPTDTYIDPQGYYHTNFALDKEGDYLALVSPMGKIIHEYFPEFPPQEADISYGMWFTMFRYFAIPTPEQPNEIQFVGFTAQSSHSHSRGFYDQPFDLLISCDTPGANIHYTLDGSEPTEQAGILYEPNSIIPITTTTIVRSVAFKPGWRTAKVTTHSYIFVDDVAQQPTDPPGWPSTWGYDADLNNNDGPDLYGIIPSDYEMDPRVVNNTLPEYSIRDALLDIPTVSISMLQEDFITENESNGIYSNALSRWERKCSFEYIFPDGSDDFQLDCKIEVHGNASRRPYRMQKHSLRLTFTSLYGPSRLEYPLFPQTDVESFNQLVLRACFTDSWGLVSWGNTRYRPNDSQYIRDVWIKESLADMGQPSSFGNFVHLYVNGLYFGVHNLTERLRKEFFADHLGGEEEDWEINEDFSSPGSRWNTMMTINPSTLGGYEQMQNYLDVEDFADYMLLHFYADSEDWPHHNGYAAANAASGDGKFRFFAWDQEIVLDYHGRAASRIDSTGGAGSLFQKMRTSEEFRLLFADRIYKHLFHNGALSVSASQNRYLKIANWIDKAIVAESARWGDTQMSTPYGNTIDQPSPLDDFNHIHYPPAPHGPDYYFTREDSWVVERDNVINNYIPDIHDTNNSYAILNLFRNENLYPNIDPPTFRINGDDQHSSHVATNDVFSLTQGQSQTYDEILYVDEYVPVRAHVPTDDTLGLSWTETSFTPDSAWTDGWTNTGVGYERGIGDDYDPMINTYVETEMYDISASVFCRIEFENDGLQTPEELYLHMKYDDGFIAYLNGGDVELTDSGNITNSTPGFADADPAHEAGASYEIFPVTDKISRLQTGKNVLAIHGINASQTSTDMLVLPKLIGKVPAGENPPEDVWYTTNGEDPRLPGGSINPHATEYSNSFVLTKSTVIKARTFLNGKWSAMNEAVYAVGPVAENLRITELMYHPDGDPNAEFIEVMNIHPTDPINLALVQFTNGVYFEFPPMQLNAGQRAVVVRDQAAFETRYGTGINVVPGEYSGSLSNGGEEIDLDDALGTEIHDFDYNDGWYEITDGLGFSLTIRDPNSTDPNDWDRKSGWRASFAVNGSPGTDDSAFVLPANAVVINELLANSDSEPNDWIELHNTTAYPIDIGGWFLSDDDIDLKKYEIEENYILPAYGYAVFYEDPNFGSTSDPGTHTVFAFNESGDKAYLTSGLGGELTGVHSAEEAFDASEPDVAFGRYIKSELDGGVNFVAMSTNTPREENAYPKVGPAVINEIVYHPRTDKDAEYVELFNMSGASVTLYDYAKSEPWRFVDKPDDPGLEYYFPPPPDEITLADGEYLLLVKDLAKYNLAYPSPPGGVTALEWGGGNLSNGGEKAELQMPGGLEGSERMYIRVDRVNYSDGRHPEGDDPWPTAPDGPDEEGSDDYVLERIDAAEYGNDVINWQADAPTPGKDNDTPP